jgi:outer membrane biosynthesis protein TonB
MRLDSTWPLHCSVCLLAGVLALAVGCSSTPDKNSGSSAGGSAAPLAQTGGPTASTDKPAEPAKSSETPPATVPAADEELIPTTPVRPAPPPAPSRPRVITNPAVPDLPEVEPAKTEPAKTEPAKTEPAKTEPAKTEPAKSEPVKSEPVKSETPQTKPGTADKVDDLVPAAPKKGG